MRNTSGILCHLGKIIARNGVAQQENIGKPLIYVLRSNLPCSLDLFSYSLVRLRGSEGRGEGHSKGKKRETAVPKRDAPPIIRDRIHAEFSGKTTT